MFESSLQAAITAQQGQIIYGGDLLMLPVLSCPVLSCPVLSCHVLSYPVLAGYVRSCAVVVCPFVHCLVQVCHDLFCHVLYTLLDDLQILKVYYNGENCKDTEASCRFDVTLMPIHTHIHTCSVLSCSALSCPLLTLVTYNKFASHVVASGRAANRTNKR